MQLPSITEKISSLPRIHKILLSILFTFILIVVAEGFYYFVFIPSNKIEERLSRFSTARNNLIHGTIEEISEETLEVESVNGDRYRLVMLPGTEVRFINPNYPLRTELFSSVSELLKEGDEVYVDAGGSKGRDKQFVFIIFTLMKFNEF